MAQYAKLLPSAGGTYVEVDLDPDFTDAVTDAYISQLVYVPSSIQPDIAANGTSTYPIIQGDDWNVGVRKSGANYFWNSGIGAGLLFAPFDFDQWVQVEIHAIAGNSAYDCRIDGTLYAGAITSPALPATGVNYTSVNSINFSWVGDGGGTTATDWVGADELSWSLDDWISQGGTTFARWGFEGADPLGDAPINYPTPPWFFWNDGSAGNVTIVAGGGSLADLSPGDTEITDVPDAVAQYVEVYIDGVEVTSCVQTGSVTRTLNRPAQATARMYSECAPGTACSRMKVYINSVLWFHGFITQISTEAGEDGALICEYTALDPMMLWQWRLARDGPASGDPGDFSNPLMFSDQFFTPTGPFILEQMLIQSEDDSDPDLGDGTLFLDHGSFPAGLVTLKGAPVDWPMTIAEVFELMSSTGVLDVYLTPIDAGGNMATIDVYNGDFGTDRTASVAFEYETGDHNVKSVRMTEDSTNVCNKLWYYLGPRVLTATDPAGDQHWRANITGDDPGLPGYPASPPYSTVIDRRDASRDDCGVRMEVKIYDAQGDENPSAFRELYRRLWIEEQWLRAIPRTLVHITPVRTSEFMLLPPGVNPVLVGDFNIGDLVTVTAGSIVRGGFTGAQRIYSYTVTWDEDGIIELGELQTSADQEGL